MERTRPDKWPSILSGLSTTVASSSGTVATPDERGAIAQASKKFHITPARGNRISVVELGD